MTFFHFKEALLTTSFDDRASDFSENFIRSYFFKTKNGKNLVKQVLNKLVYNMLINDSKVSNQTFSSILKFWGTFGLLLIAIRILR